MKEKKKKMYSQHLQEMDYVLQSHHRDMPLIVHMKCKNVQVYMCILFMYVRECVGGIYLNIQANPCNKRLLSSLHVALSNAQLYATSKIVFYQSVSQSVSRGG